MTAPSPKRPRRRRSYTTGELAEMAGVLRKLLDAVESGDLAADAGTVAALGGAVAALEVLATGQAGKAESAGSA